MSNFFQNPNGICEDAPCCGCCGSEPESNEREDAQEQESERRGWDAGEDDFADYNANEADDYRDE